MSQMGLAHRRGFENMANQRCYPQHDEVIIGKDLYYNDRVRISYNIGLKK